MVDSSRRMPRAEREQQMLAAAHALFAQRGYAAVAMDDVAAAVGVTKPLLYNYWGNKERLFLACMERSADALFDAVLAAVRAEQSPGAAARAGMRAFFAFVEADRGAWRIVFDSTLPGEGVIAARVASERERITTLVADAFLAQIPDARRAAARTEVEALSHAVLGAAEALARWWLRTEALPAQHAAELLIETLVPGLQARAQSGATTNP
jgi:AcrR family transcriptional regulator